MSDAARAALPGSHPGPRHAWLLAVRPPTLTAAIAPVLVGTAVAIRDGVFAPAAALAALFGALALQAGANLANDVADFQRGADTDARLGPPRVTQQGLLTERQVVTGMWIAFGLATLAGMYLLAVAGWVVVAIGLSSIVAAIAYTGGPWPYGYRALGEVFTFLFFGVIAVGGTYFVQAEVWTADVLLASLPVGCTVTAILVVNNVRDIETDRRAGKRTLAVLLGRRGAQRLYLALLAAAYLMATALWPLAGFSPLVLLAWLSLPLAIAPARAVATAVEGPPLNAALRASSGLHLWFSAALALGLAW